MKTIALPLLALAACTPASKPGTSTGGETATVVTNMTELPRPDGAPTELCDASKVQDVIGKPRSDALAEDARVRAGARLVRYLTPGMAVTMEFRGDRLNLHVGTNGKIGSARCG